MREKCRVWTWTASNWRSRRPTATRYLTIKPEGEAINTALVDKLVAKNVDVRAEKQTQSGFLSMLGVWLPFIVLIGVWMFFMNRMQGGGKGGAMGFGKSRAKLLTEKHRPRDL
jgi:cell division protease FtsH